MRLSEAVEGAVGWCSVSVRRSTKYLNCEFFFALGGMTLLITWLERIAMLTPQQWGETSDSASAVSAALTRSSSPLGQQSVAVPLAVVVRIRPLSPSEIDIGQRNVWSHSESQIWQSSPSDGRTFAPSQAYDVDHVFGTDSRTYELYEKVLEAHVACTLLGFNSTVLCYGQTSSGKTTTIRGGGGTDGVISLSTRQLLEAITAKGSLKLRMSYLEIYNETVQDLISG